MRDGRSIFAMRELKLSPAFYSQFRRRLWSIVVPFVLLFFGILFWVETQWLAQFFGSPSLLYFVLPIGAVAVMIGTIVGVNRIQQRWRSYRLVLDDSSITRLQDGSPPVSIRFSEITKISEAPGAGITLLASDPPRRIGVPATMENFQELRYELAQARLIESVPHQRTRGRQLLAVGMFLVTTISMLVALVAHRSEERR